MSDGLPCSLDFRSEKGSGMGIQSDRAQMSSGGEDGGWLQGKIVVSLESRFPKEFAGLIERRGGTVIQAPSLVEIPDPGSPSVHRFVEGVAEGSFAMVVLLTGVGTRMCIEASERAGRLEEFCSGLAKVKTICRGPKPVAVLRKNGIEPTEMAPEPHTSEQLASVLNRRATEVRGQQVALQHYGVDNPFIRSVLDSLGGDVFDVYPYTWGLPDDTGPLADAIDKVARRDVDAVCFTSSPQVANMVEVAKNRGILADLVIALSEAVVAAAVGPVAAKALLEYGIQPQVQPSRPKMADLVRALDAFDGRFGP
jgi:uroporphyrinogen-III synthase